jgi:hypothetical protein
MTTIIISLAALFGLALLVRVAQAPETAAPLADLISGTVKPIVAPMVDLINKPTFVYIASSCLILSAFVVIAVYLRRVTRPEMKAIRRAEIAIKALPKPTGADWRQTCSELSTILGRHGVLISAWAAFTQDAAVGRRMPSRSFTHYAVNDPDNGLNRRGGIMAALPGYYTTVGLILTFVGLVVALYFAARGFRSGDMEEAHRSIVQLLNASSFKFLTSVAALAGAFLISIAHRAALSRVRRATFRLLTTIDLRLQHLRAFEAQAGNDVDPAVQMVEKLDQILAEMTATRQAIEALRSAQRESA